MRLIVKKNLLAFTFSLLTFATVYPAAAATFSEQPGNNEQIATAQNLGAITGDNTISGNLTAIPFDVDLFAFSLQADSSLTVSVDDPFFDTQLFLFNAGGFGITGNDNTDFTLLNPSFSFTVNTTGVYYLGITGNNYDPIDSSGNFIFSDDATGSFSLTSLASLAGWTKRDPDAFDPASGNYTINVSTTSVPEPSALFGLIAWSCCMAQVTRKRKAIG
jgi:Bacterial pre-peptidase C-terminal domain